MLCCKVLDGCHWWNSYKKCTHTNTHTHITYIHTKPSYLILNSNSCREKLHTLYTLNINAIRVEQLTTLKYTFGSDGRHTIIHYPTINNFFNAIFLQCFVFVWFEEFCLFLFFFGKCMRAYSIHHLTKLALQWEIQWYLYQNACKNCSSHVFIHDHEQLLYKNSDQ